MLFGTLRFIGIIKKKKKLTYIFSIIPIVRFFPSCAFSGNPTRAKRRSIRQMANDSDPGRALHPPQPASFLPTARGHAVCSRTPRTSNALSVHARYRASLIYDVFTFSMRKRRRNAIFLPFPALPAGTTGTTRVSNYVLRQTPVNGQDRR